MNNNLFQINAIKISSLAEKIFSKLDRNLQPGVYAAAIDIAKRSPEIFLEPSGSDFTSKITSDLNRSIVLESDDEVPLNQNILLEFDILEKIKTAFEKNISIKDRVAFFSNHFTTDTTLTLIVLVLDKKSYDSHYRLNQSFDESVNQYPSFLDAAVSRFLKDSSRLFKDIIENKESILEDNEIETNILKLAGNSFMVTAARTAVEKSSIEDTVMFPKLSKFYDQITLISSLLYEGRECSGKIILVPPCTREIEESFLLKRKIPLSDQRAVRKLLEICDDKTSLLYQSGHIYGLGTLPGKIKQMRKPFFQIVFKKHYSWSLTHGSNEMMNSVYGNPYLSDRPFDTDDLCSRILKTFPDLSNMNLRKVTSLISKATFQKHGTIIVLTSNALSEAERLKNQAVLFEPFQMTENNLVKFSNIDGALILDERLMCYGVGVILDGKASENGDPARGSRYNSAVRYVESQNYTAMAVVISEDGMVDFI